MIKSYADDIAELLNNAIVTDTKGHVTPVDIAVPLTISSFTHAKKLIFIGNGGSAAIASHLAIDYAKNGGIRAVAFNDSSLLTCLGNDVGYENVFAKAIEMYADVGDKVIAISSSGESPNILNGARASLEKGCLVYTFSGFSANNTLRKTGDINYYVPSKKGDYGLTEITHLALLHLMLDIICEQNKHG